MKQPYSHYPFQKALHVSELISLFYAKSPRNFQFNGETHDFWELIYIDKGKMLITAGDNQYILKAGELAFHKPGEFHAVSAYENIPSNYIVASFVCHNPAMQYFEHRFITLTSRERDCLYEAASHGRQAFGDVRPPHSIKETAGGCPFGEIQLIQTHLEMLLILLLQRSESNLIQKRVESHIQQTRHKQLTEQVKEYLEVHIDKPLTLSQIANDLGYSVSQMKKLFAAERGGGIMHYFIDLKMDEAKRLMKEGSLNLSQIAQQLGYDNASYFSRLFKQRHDMTPTEYSCSFGQ